MSKIGDYVIWLEENGYTEWDDWTNSYVPTGHKKTDPFEEYLRSQKRMNEKYGNKKQ